MQAQAKARHPQTEPLLAEAGRPQAAAPRLGPAAGRLAPSHPSSAGARSLTPRQQQVARRVARGETNRQIARALALSEGTGANHVRHILQRLGMHSHAEIPEPSSTIPS